MKRHGQFGLILFYIIPVENQSWAKYNGGSFGGMYGMVFKLGDGYRIIEKKIYIAIGLAIDGEKEALGLWRRKHESAASWMSTLTDLKARALKD